MKPNIISVVLMIAFLAVVTMFGGGGGYSASGGCKSLSYSFAYSTSPWRNDTVTYALFCEVFPIDREFSQVSELLSITLPDKKKVMLPYAEGRQFWVSKTGEVRILEKVFTAEDLKRIVRLCSGSSVDMKNLDEVRQKLEKNP